MTRPLVMLLVLGDILLSTVEPVAGHYSGALSPGDVIPVKIHTINAAFELHQERNVGSIGSS